MVLPTFPLGPGDVAPTPTGKVVLDFLNGKMPAFVDTALNVAHVDDLALGHVAALERGGTGRSYILGGENLSMRAILQTLADYTGLPMPRLQVPRRLVLTAGAASTLIEGRLLRREPHVPLEGARMSSDKMIFNDERARARRSDTHHGRLARRSGSLPAGSPTTATWQAAGAQRSSGANSGVRCHRARLPATGRPRGRRRSRH